jgi:hypothetical protein
LVAAIAALKESTATIEKQADSLQRHREHQLRDTFKCQPRGCERTTQHLIDPIGRKDALEFQQLRFAVSASCPVLVVAHNLDWRGDRGVHVELQFGLRRRLADQEDDRTAIDPASASGGSGT